MGNGFLPSLEAASGGIRSRTYLVSAVVKNVNIYRPFAGISQLIRGRMNFVTIVRKNVHVHPPREI